MLVFAEHCGAEHEYKSDKIKLNLHNNFLTNNKTTYLIQFQGLPIVWTCLLVKITSHCLVSARKLRIVVSPRMSLFPQASRNAQPVGNLSVSVGYRYSIYRQYHYFQVDIRYFCIDINLAIFCGIDTLLR